ncbi:MAG: ligase-associated DNA damage response DEXH box helicase [Bacteroidia bacterium]
MQEALQWYENRHWEMFEFQKKCLEHYMMGESGMLNAPTGMGKTFALSIPFLLEHKLAAKPKKGLKALWITPLRALSVDIRNAIQEASDELNVGWRIERRSGDVSASTKKAQLVHAPDCLITTPESVHLLLATKGYERFFKNLEVVIVDEWHELLSSKRGVQVELALSRLKSIRPDLKIWGISATIGNMEEAMKVLLGSDQAKNAKHVISERKKELEFHTMIPKEIDRFPWSGHLGIRMLKDTLPIIEANSSTILFTNTRSQAEIWYSRLIDECPELIGEIAMHHGSLDKELRKWVEEALHAGRLKAVVSTSSLDLGVDFRPVSAVIQIGSPKGIARFVQRAGRSGHSPYEKSKVYFLPTNSMEIIESLALKSAVENHFVESRIPVIRAFDLLIQYMVSLAVSDGFKEKELYEEVRSTHCYSTLSKDEWMNLCQFITQGGESLQAYEEFNKVEVVDGLYRVLDRRIARRHRLSMGTIVGDTAMKVSYQNGRRIGTIEEYFISRMNIGDCFSFAGQTLELIQVKGFTAYVKPARAKKVAIPSWQGGRMSLSSEISEVIRLEIGKLNEGTSPEHISLKPLLSIQTQLSRIPKSDELLIESFKDEEGHHVFVYPFEGRMVNEGLALLMAYRISQHKRITLSVAMNDYGFELLSDQEIPLEEALEQDVFTNENLLSDVQASCNLSEMGRRKFRDIAVISGLTFRGYPGKLQKERHLQSSASLFYDVFNDYDRDNLLLQQAYEEVLYQELDSERLKHALDRIQSQKIMLEELEEISPFAFPIMVDRLREGLSNERIEDRVNKILADILE